LLLPDAKTGNIRFGKFQFLHHFFG
jgi:hypothetical protein